MEEQRWCVFLRCSPETVNRWALRTRRKLLLGFHRGWADLWFLLLLPLVRPALLPFFYLPCFGVRSETRGLVEMAKKLRIFKTTRCLDATGINYMAKNKWPEFLAMKSFSSLFAWRFVSDGVCVCVCVCVSAHALEIKNKLTGVTLESIKGV